jgi:hypothetical protein
MEQVGTININFSIFSDSPTHLSVADLSDFLYAQNLPAYLSITPPGSRKSKNFTFAKGKINTFNSHNLGLSCLKGDCTDEEYISLPDGIYQICLKSGFEGIEKSKFYLKTDNFRLEYAKVNIKYGLEFSKDNMDFILYMTKIKYILGVAEDHAMLGDFVKSQRFFEEAKDMLKKYMDCKDCL